MSVALFLRDPAMIPDHAHASHDQYMLLPDPHGAIVGWIDAEGSRHEERVVGRHLWVVPQGIEHFVSWPKRETIVTIYVNRLAAPDLIEPPITSPELFDLTHLENRDPQLRQSVRSLQYLCHHRRRGFTHYAEAAATVVVMNIMLQLWDRFPEPIVRRIGFSEFAVERIIEYIDENLAEELSIEDLAEAVSMSRAHFFRLFKRTFSYPPIEFVMRRRVTKASEELTYTTKKESDIAAVCGFADQGHMARQFRRVLGHKPSDIRFEGRLR